MADSRDNGTVLVLDDDPDNAATVVELLVQAGHRVHSVARGEYALEAMRDEQISLVLIDTDDQPMGMDLVRVIKRDHHQVPLIVMSSDESALVLAGEAGADEYLPKPLDADDLLILIGELAA
jgi:DNA-binding response OmpR family regulator